VVIRDGEIVREDAPATARQAAPAHHAPVQAAPARAPPADAGGCTQCAVVTPVAARLPSTPAAISS